MLLKKYIKKLFPNVARFYSYRKEEKLFETEGKETPFGFKFSGNMMMVDGTFEEVETSISQKFLKQTEVFINIGANVGYYCCHALNLGVHTLAFEPIALNQKYLIKNIKENFWQDNIEFFPIALSDKTGLIDIYGSGTAASLIHGWAGVESAVKQTVAVSTLDSIVGMRFVGKKIFAIVDVEGAEYLLLEGASGILRQEPKPSWMIEICYKEHQPSGIEINPNFLRTFELMWDSGYESYAVSEKITKVDKKIIQRVLNNEIPNFNVFTFIFIEKGKSLDFL